MTDLRLATFLFANITGFTARTRAVVPLDPHVASELSHGCRAQRDLVQSSLHRGGRLVVGELFGDPHWVSPGRLRERAERVGLRFGRRHGGPIGYFSRFQR